LSQPQEIVTEQPAPVAAPDLSDTQSVAPDLSDAQPVAPVNEVETTASVIESAPQNAEPAADSHAAAVAKKERLTQLLKAEHEK
jgi:hypothetical protein